MNNFFRLLLEINDASFWWYLGISATLIVLDWIGDGLLSQFNISKKILVFVVIISGTSKLFFRRKLIQLINKDLPLQLKSSLRNNLQQLSLLMGGLLLIIWVTFWHSPTLNIRHDLGVVGLSNIGASGLLFFMFVLILLSVINDNSDDVTNTIETVAVAKKIKEVYQEKTELIQKNRLLKNFPLRYYAHQTEYGSIVKFIRGGETVLDNGCGDGALAILLAKKGAIVTACDISKPNIQQAKIFAAEEGLANQINFLTADSENLPFNDHSFDWVISCHVLEHLPDFQLGLKEVRRVTKKRAIIALPTCLNPCAAVILGGDSFWTISRWTPFAWFIGLGKIILNLGGEGVDEGYGGNQDLPHVWRYPWVMKKRIQSSGFRIIHFEASSLCLPYFNFLLPLIKYLEKFKAKPIIRNFGYGSIAVVEK